MTKMLKVAIISLLLLTGVASANFLEEAWNFKNERIFGKVKKIEVFEESGSLKRTVYYNEKGQKTRIEDYRGKGGKLISEFSFEYNKDGNLYRASLTAQGAEDSAFVGTAEYLSKGIIKFITYIFKDGDKEQTFKTYPFEYDEKKRIKSFKVKAKDDLIACDYKFDDNGNCTEYILDVGEKRRTETKYRGYHNGVPQTEESRSLGKKSMSTVLKYKFDKFGNWIERTREITYYGKGKDGKPKSHIRTVKQKRTIMYYPEKKKSD